ncbi:unnamed protein product [Phytophthora fragariaefolia]|uniref:Unnamed protein product n=1 Tax=Phytophthora fragariaefolia TaxID=1490495 RepID=A0A9W7CZA0_9STRA|nr:unnamed protein product [Phytophthora fragariaefolia]
MAGTVASDHGAGQGEVAALAEGHQEAVMCILRQLLEVQCMSEIRVTLRGTAHRPFPGVPVADNVSSPPSLSAEASSCLVWCRTASHSIRPTLPDYLGVDAKLSVRSQMQLCEGAMGLAQSWRTTTWWPYRGFPGTATQSSLCGLGVHGQPSSEGGAEFDDNTESGSGGTARSNDRGRDQEPTRDGNQLGGGAAGTGTGTSPTGAGDTGPGRAPTSRDTGNTSGSTWAYESAPERSIVVHEKVKALKLTKFRGLDDSMPVSMWLKTMRVEVRRQAATMGVIWNDKQLYHEVAAHFEGDAQRWFATVMETVPEVDENINTLVDMLRTKYMAQRTSPEIVGLLNARRQMRGERLVEYAQALREIGERGEISEE